MPSTEFRSMVRFWLLKIFPGNSRRSRSSSPWSSVARKKRLSGCSSNSFRISAINCSVVLFPIETALSVRRIWTPTQRGAKSFVKESMRFCRAAVGT